MVVSCYLSRNSGNYSSAFISNHEAVGEKKSGSARLVATLEELLARPTKRAPSCLLVNPRFNNKDLLSTSLVMFQSSHSSVRYGCLDTQGSEKSRRQTPGL